MRIGKGIFLGVFLLSWALWVRAGELECKRTIAKNLFSEATMIDPRYPSVLVPAAGHDPNFEEGYRGLAERVGPAATYFYSKTGEKVLLLRNLAGRAVPVFDGVVYRPRGKNELGEWVKYQKEVNLKIIDVNYSFVGPISAAINKLINANDQPQFWSSKYGFDATPLSEFISRLAWKTSEREVIEALKRRIRLNEHHASDLAWFQLFKTVFDLRVHPNTLESVTPTRLIVRSLSEGLPDANLRRKIRNYIRSKNSYRARGDGYIESIILTATDSDYIYIINKDSVEKRHFSGIPSEQDPELFQTNSGDPLDSQKD